MISTTNTSSRPNGYSNVCETVISEVAVTNGVPPEELDQVLNEVIDPDALEKLFEDRNCSTGRGLGVIEFVFSGCEVTVRSSGDVSVSLLEDSSSYDAENVSGEGDHDNSD